ncbi:MULTISPECIES: CHASE domain-containing protein [unclassified Phenylobacterium]|uniref:CHASE domain-containing protein n=1 Tax=unclassified Phenylobacterium TaxID=2640670 RepID=UPI00083B201B|nr:MULTISPECIES: CHASE domain-containing protein [unclassified Phenylobacterium]
MAKLSFYRWLPHLIVPALVLLVGTVATLLTALQLRDVNDARDASRLRLEANEAVAALEERLEGHSALLRGVAGLFAASDDVTAAEFSAYVERLGLGTRYPGVLGIGYSVWLPDAEARAELEAEMRRRGQSNFRVWPAGRRPPYTAIVYLSPERRNAPAIGYDMFSEATRREAMQRAAAGGDLAMSGPVTLVQEPGRYRQPGVLMFLPVTNAGAQGPRLSGFVYSPLRSGDLLQTVFPARPDRLVDVSVYDGATRRENLLFETAAPAARPQVLRAVPVAGRTWTLAIRTRPAFDAGSNRSLVYWTAGLGAAITLALTFAVLMQARAALLAERARMELREVNAGLEDRVARRTGELANAVAELRDEMARRETAESQVRQMQKMEAIGQLTGGIAHDFNNMLAIVIGSLDMARRRLTGAEDPRVTRYLDNAAEGAARAATLTGRLLAFARRQRLNPEPLDVNELVGGMTELLRRSLGERVAIETALADGLWPVRADAAELENALLNLAVNARDAMPDGGRLTVSTSNTHDPAAGDPAAPPAGEFVTIRIADTGEGMTPDVIERAFEPFFTTKEVGKGTGLGLSQVYGFVNQSGGAVTIRSVAGAGATVTIYLPRWAGELASKVPAPADGPLPRARRGEAVLVVEDEPEVRRLSVESLRELGYDVTEASDADQALQRLAEAPAADLLFTDILMPGMNGVQLAERARAAKPALKVLYTTGYARDVSGAEAVQAALLAKPFTIAQLAHRVRQALDEDRAA